MRKETNTKITKMMKLSRKDFKATITKIFQKAIINILEIHKKKKRRGSSHCGSVEMNLTSAHEDKGSIPVLAQWVKDLGLL